MTDTKPTKPTKKPYGPNTVALALSFSTEFKREISPAMIRRIGRRINIPYARGYGQGHQYTATEISEIRKLLKEGGLRVIAARARKGTKLAKPAQKPASKKAPEPKLSASQKAKAQSAASAMKAPVKKA